jgi:hypothetical protein
MARPLHDRESMNNRIPSLRLVPPSISTPWLVAIIAAALVCLAVPTIAGAAPATRGKSARSASVVAHLDVSMGAGKGRASHTARLSLRISGDGQPAEMLTEVDGAEYRVKARRVPGASSFLIDVELDVHRRGPGAPFELAARIPYRRGELQLLGQAGSAGAPSTRATITLE